MRSLNRAAERVKSPEKAALLEMISWGGVGLSVVLASIGVGGLIGFDSILTKAGSLVLIVGTLLTEVAASRLPVHAQRRYAEGAWIKSGFVVIGFAALTFWNLVASHFGMTAIDHASVQGRRAPLERIAATADAARETAEEALAAFDAETRLQSEQMGLALRGAFESGYVTSAARNAREASESRSERRVALAQAVSDARAADRAAERALEAAPKPRRDIELWGFAAVLELLKGALVWFATTNERKKTIPKNSGAEILAADPRLLGSADRRALKSRCASILATIRHMEAARA